MTTQQNILRTMMTQLDDASDQIPEGLYLQFCNHLKNLHTCKPVPVAPRRSSGPRRCGRCHQLGHTRRRCYYYEVDARALSLAYRNGQTPAEAGIEKEPGVIIYSDRHARSSASAHEGVTWSPANGGNIVVEIYVPDARREMAPTMTFRDFARFQGRRVLHIKIPGKYKAEITLPAKLSITGDAIRSNRHTWSPRRGCITLTLQLVGVDK